MEESTLKRDHEPAPLDRQEIMAFVGAAMIVIGVFCPAISVPGPQSFFAIGNTVAAILLGMAGATAWSIAMRRPASVMWNGLLAVLIVLAFGIAVWSDEVREPVRTFFGTMQSELRPTSWILIGIGAALVALAGHRARGSSSRSTQPVTPTHSLAIAGMVLATLGCLFGIALTFGPMSSGSLRKIGRSWEDQLNMVRWLLVAGSIFGVVLSAQVPRLADQTLRFVTGITWFLVGNAFFILLSTEVVASLYLAVVWNIACFGLLLWKTNPRRSWARRERLVLWFPYLAVGVLLLVMCEFGDLFLAAGPPVVATTTGYMICRSSKWADGAIFTAMILLGIPASILAFGDVPNEYLEPCGLSLSEGRVMLLIFVGVLAWAIILSFCPTPTDTPGGVDDATSRRLDELESDSDAAS